MKIVHASGIPYELNPGTTLEFTRKNPFFSKMGEQSLPITLPASPHNLHLLRNPGRTDNRQKLESRLDASIQSGVFFVNARQAVLSARNKDKITTSFYLRNGAFFEKMQDVSLMEVFKDEEVRFANVNSAILFCRNLMNTRDSRFACFPVVTENYWINRLLGSVGGNAPQFENATERTITINDRQISVPRGMFISPFVRVRHVVEKVLRYLGDYKLAPGSFLDIAPFNDMVFLNDTLDTIASGAIRYIDIVPNITISALFDVLRKFNVEPMPNDTLQTVSLVSFNQVLESPVQVDLSDCIHKEPVVGYHHDYKQLKLSSQRMSLPDIIKPFSMLTVRGNESTRVSTVDTSRSDASFMDILARFPSAYIDRIAGSIRANGFRGDREVDREVGSLSLDYFEGYPELSVDERRFPDVVPEIISVRSWNSAASAFITSGVTPYCGRGRFVQSSLEFSDDSYSELSDDRELRPMLCLTYNDATQQAAFGTLSNFNIRGQRLWDFSLMFNGADGIFERFWRQRDNLLRNALLEVKYDLLLSEKHKFTLSALEKVMLRNQEYLIDEIKYTPEKATIESCCFLSVRQQYDENNELSTAKTESELFPAHSFRWVLRTHRNFQIDWHPRSTGTAQVIFLSDPTEFFPPPPTQAQFNQGGRHFEQQFEVEYGQRLTRYPWFSRQGTGIITAWLEAVGV